LITRAEISQDPSRKLARQKPTEVDDRAMRERKREASLDGI